MCHGYKNGTKKVHWTRLIAINGYTTKNHSLVCFLSFRLYRNHWTLKIRTSWFIKMTFECRGWRNLEWVIRWREKTNKPELKISCKSVIYHGIKHSSFVHMWKSKHANRSQRFTDGDATSYRDRVSFDEETISQIIIYDWYT